MTISDPLSKIAALESDPALPLPADRAEDARRLVAIMPIQGVEKLRRIRWQSEDISEFEFHWQRANKMNSPGDRVTRIRTTGNGRFTVKCNRSLDNVQWQKDSNREPLMGQLLLDLAGAEEVFRSAVGPYSEQKQTSKE